MLRISKLSDYAILVMVALQEQPDALLSAHSLADRTSVELPTASKVLKQLCKALLVTSCRGAKGGYQLARPAGEISVADIIAAIEGPIAMTECSVEPGLCSQEEHCNLRSNWQRISMAVADALKQVTLAEMAQPLPTRSINELSIMTVNA